MTTAPPPIPRPAWPLAGLTTGLLLAAADLALAPRLTGHLEPPTLASRVLALALLPAAGALLGAAASIPGRAFAWLWPGALAAWLGHQLALGPRASTMPLASSWSVILGLAAALAFMLAARPARRQPGRWRLLALTAAAVAYTVAALAYRGWYAGVRESVVGLAAMLVFFAVLPAWRRAAAPLAGVLSLAALAGGAFGVFSLRDQATADWADEATSALSPISRRVSLALVDRRVRPAPTEELTAHPFFGTPLASASLRRLREAAGGAPRGVLLITLDAVRADLLGGRAVAGRAVTPVLDSLAARGVLFERAYSPGAISHVTLLSMFSGLLPSRVFQGEGGLDAFPLVTERLEAAGVETRACYPRAVIHTKLESFTRHGFGFRSATLHPGADLTVEDTWRRVRPQGEGRWLGYVHFLTPHAPYRPEPRFRAGSGDFEDYAGDVRQADDMVRRLLALLARDGLTDGTLVIVSADHGEEFLEHGHRFHGRNLYEESIHVPLIVVGPGIAPQRVAIPVTLCDLAPTLEHLFGLPDEGRPSYAGRSLVPALVGLDDPDRRPEVLAEVPPLKVTWMPAKTALIREREKLIVDERRMRFYLFDLAEDPGERRNLAPERPDRVDALWARLRAIRALAGADTVPPEDPSLETAELLFVDGGPTILARFLLDQTAVLQPFFIARGIAFLAEAQSLPELDELAARFSDHGDAEIRLACRLLLAGHRRAGDPAEARAALARDFATTDDPVLLACLYNHFRRVKDPALLDAAPPAVTQYGDVLELARLTYRASLGHLPADSAAIEAAAKHESPWVEKMAADAAAILGDGNR